MRLEILVDSEEPTLYPLNKPEVMVGAGQVCDIVLTSVGISRKHVKIVSEKDKYFIVDQGSTNGTFINEERLIPGRKTEFTTFFPVRLGARVLLTLVGDDDLPTVVKKMTAPIPIKPPSSPKELTSTSVLSLKDIQSSSTKALVKGRQEAEARKKTTVAPLKKAKKVKEEKRMFLTVLFALSLFGGALYYNFYMLEANTKAKIAPVVKLPPKPQPVMPPVEVVTTSQKINDAELIPRERLAAAFNDLICLIPEELYFCERIPAMKKNTGGVASVGNSMIFLVEETFWMEEGRHKKRQHLMKLGTKSIPTIIPTDEGVEKIAFLTFFRDSFAPLSLRDYQEKDFYIVMYSDKKDVKTAITHVFAFKVSSVPEIMKQLTPKFFENYISFGPGALSVVDHLYTKY